MGKRDKRVITKGPHAFVPKVRGNHRPEPRSKRGGVLLGRVLINRQPNANLDAPPNVRYWG